MTSDVERLAVLETHVESIVQNQPILSKKIDKIFDALEEIKIIQAAIPCDTMQKRMDYLEKENKNIMDWISITKGSLISLKFIYPVVQAILVAFVVWKIQGN